MAFTDASSIVADLMWSKEMGLRTTHSMQPKHSAYPAWLVAVEALEEGNVDLLNRTLEDYPILLDFCTQDEDHFELIHLAAKLGNVDALAVLLEHGAYVDSRSGAYIPVVDGNGPIFEPGWTPVIVAIRFGQHDAAQFLLKAYADVALEFTDGLTAMGAARELGDTALVQLVSECGVSELRRSHHLDSTERSRRMAIYVEDFQKRGLPLNQWLIEWREDLRRLWSKTR